MLLKLFRMYLFRRVTKDLWCILLNSRTFITVTPSGYESHRKDHLEKIIYDLKCIILNISNTTLILKKKSLPEATVLVRYNPFLPAPPDI